MKGFRSAAVLWAAVMLTVVMAGSPAQAEPGWREVNSQAGGFSLLAPAAPVVKKRSFQLNAAGNAWGEIERTEYIMAGQGIVYRVAFFDLPDQLLKTAGPVAAMEAMVQSRLERVRSEPVSRSEIKLGGHPGLEVVRLMANNATLVLRVYLVDNRCYELLVAARPELASSLSIKRFLESFALTGRQ